MCLLWITLKNAELSSFKVTETWIWITQQPCSYIICCMWCGMTSLMWKWLKEMLGMHCLLHYKCTSGSQNLIKSVKVISKLYEREKPENVKFDQIVDYLMTQPIYAHLQLEKLMFCILAKLQGLFGIWEYYFFYW